MKANFITTSEANNASQEATLAVEMFLMTNYRFRRNILNGKVEYAILPKAENSADGLSSASVEAELEYRPLTQAALNSIVIRAKREQIMEKGSPKTEIAEYVASEEVPEYNPVLAFMKGLPKWDGQNHIAKVFGRIPGITSEQLNYLTIWLRSTVAHWKQMDMPPKQLREYYLDHLNLSNKFDKEMALTNNLLVNLDELDAISSKQHAKLKQTLSVSKVNGRPIFGRTQEDRPRFASFVATTNNPHPLTDPTGSRRYICIQIPEGHLINNEGEIDNGQLYAQVVYELEEQKAPYWFSNDEVARIQQLNQEFMEKKDLSEMFEACFRQPVEGENVKTMSCDEIIGIMQKDYPTLVKTIGNKVKLGKAITALGYKQKNHSHVTYYEVVPRKAA